MIEHIPTQSANLLSYSYLWRRIKVIMMAHVRYLTIEKENVQDLWANELLFTLDTAQEMKLDDDGQSKHSNIFKGDWNSVRRAVWIFIEDSEDVETTSIWFIDCIICGVIIFDMDSDWSPSDIWSTFARQTITDYNVLNHEARGTRNICRSQCTPRFHVQPDAHYNSVPEAQVSAHFRRDSDVDRMSRDHANERLSIGWECRWASTGLNWTRSRWLL